MSHDTILIGSTVRVVSCGRPLHRIPTQIALAGLQPTLMSLYGLAWYACVMFSDGRGTMRGPLTTTPRPAQDVIDRLFDIAVLANHSIAHDGHWVAVWDGSRMSMLWRDQDGDAQFTVDYDEPWTRVAPWSANDMVERAEAGYVAWAERMRAVDRRSQDTIKAAQGERSAAATPSLLIH